MQPDDPLAGKTPEEVAAEAERRRKAEEARKVKAIKDAEQAERRRQVNERRIVCVVVWRLLSGAGACCTDAPCPNLHLSIAQIQEASERMAKETPEERALRERRAVSLICWVLT